MYPAVTLALAALTAPVAPPPAATPSAIIARWVRGTSQDRPRVSVWLNRDEVYNRGDQARVYFKSDRDAYVTIVRIDTDGRMRVLFPIDPWEDNWARGGRTFEVLGRDRDEAFRVDDYPGVGYLFAIASSDHFNYDDIVRGDHWDYQTISDGRVRGDPYVAVSDLAERIAQEGEYDYDVTEYYVERHYDYPRFVCYDCHTYASWRYWDPYDSYCSRFRIVIYDDWFYYPYRRYGGGGVFVRPYRPGPRYVFKDADPRNDYVTRVVERPRGDPDVRRSTGERDRTSADVGGRGSIPTPDSPRRRTTENPGRGTSPDDSRRRPVTREPHRETRPQTPDGQREPRRRDEPERTRDPGTVRDVPPSQGETPRRRPVEDRPQSPSRTREGATQDRTREPSRRESEPRSSGRESGTHDRTREPSRRESEPRSSGRESAREAPREREPVRQAPPRSEPRVQSPPRSTGEPQLKRRRPN